MLGRDLRKRYLGRGGLGLNGLPSLVMCIAIACLKIFPFFFVPLAEEVKGRVWVVVEGSRGHRVGDKRLNVSSGVPGQVG